MHIIICRTRKKNGRRMEEEWKKKGAKGKMKKTEIS